MKFSKLDLIASKYIRLFADQFLRMFHYCFGLFKKYPRVFKTCCALFVSLFLIIGSRYIYQNWENLFNKNAAEHDDEIVHRTEEELSKFGADFAEAAPGKLHIELKVPGEIKLNGDSVAHMVPRFPGLAKQVLKNLGDQVKKGDVLAIFENSANMAIFEMRAQIDGTIIEKNITLGEVLGTSEEAFTVADLSSVWVDLYVYPADLTHVRAGQRVRVLDQASGTSSDGILSYVAPTVSDHTRTSLARVKLENPELKWRPGTFITGAILVDESDAPLLINKQAVVDIGGVSTVFVRNNNYFIAKPVKTGRMDDLNVEILDGISSGSRIVVKGSFLLKSELAKAGLEDHEH
jgi:cobalt-zinc-cadmium efflux system membrane fusion protein